MATTVVEFAPSTEKTTFADSCEEDISYAKTFWQSVQLLPPLESRLVSSDIKQRLRVAPPGSQRESNSKKKSAVDKKTAAVTQTYPERPPPEKLTQFLKRAQDLEQAERIAHMAKLAARREEDLVLLHKHRAQRVDKERISTGQGVKPLPPAPPPMLDHELAEDFDEDPGAAQRAIEQFEKERDIARDESDSD